MESSRQPISLSVIVPVYNESDNIAALHAGNIRSVGELHATYEIIYIDDVSTDGSEDWLDSLAATDKQVKVIHLRRNFGQTEQPFPPASTIPAEASWY